ncbi:MAG TPA: hypothetical protein VHV82_13370 [Sporichthyaceae bacterium]|jgi:hypothetical protein|nr:hypothetical protein [Sporichthyaceae bacterium]
MSKQIQSVAPGHPVEAPDALIAMPTDPDFDPDADLAVVTTHQIRTGEAFGRFWKLTPGDRRWMIAAAALLIAAAAADTAAILLFGYIVDHVLTADAGLRAFWRPAADWAGMTTLGTLVSAGSPRVQLIRPHPSSAPGRLRKHPPDR